MTSNTTATDSGLVSNRLVYVGLWLTAGLSYGGFLAFDRGVLAVAAFVLFGGAAVVYERVGDVRFDERDGEVLGYASSYTIQIVGILSALLFPALVLARALGHYEWTPFVGGVAATVAVVFVLWGAMLLLVRARR
jgi:uncharacterized membrane protein